MLNLQNNELGGVDNVVVYECMVYLQEKTRLGRTIFASKFKRRLMRRWRRPAKGGLGCVRRAIEGLLRKVIKWKKVWLKEEEEEEG